ncbi:MULTISPECIES: hypothetical protein [unclassified Paraburkholderia]|uniref:hypothetical protein n=1 Tax=unclassified Paraburkholderia TaxID=2615204 RepID=UPI00161FC98C|nr:MULTISPECIES: hypothetical protein [unclassified Paraburkholderia]MBB5445332.1 hypothetical protein [Paraburkholderia sp. WSM4177]MBB5485880.1 hypothetical protein [Paraburkholderia sp. WSM4180]
MRIVKVPSLIGGHATPDLSAATWCVVLLVLCIVATAHDSVLPAKFLLDELVISDRMKTVTKVEAYGDSFDNLAWIFKFFSLTNPGITLIGFAASVLSLTIAVWKARVESLTVIEMVLVAFWLVNQTVYVGLPSKEIVIALLMLVVFSLHGSRAVMPIFAIGAMLVAVYFRSYWAITLCATFVLYFAPPFMRRPVALLFMGLLLFAVVSVVFANVYGQSIEFARQAVNQYRDENDASSIIQPFFNGDGMIIGIVNVVLTWTTFFVPLRLITSGSPLQTAGGIGVFLTFVMLFNRYRLVIALFPAVQFDRLCFCFLFSFIATQALFEPDYGSYLKHLSPISPIILYLILRLRGLKISNEMSRRVVNP